MKANRGYLIFGRLVVIVLIVIGSTMIYVYTQGVPGGTGFASTGNRVLEILPRNRSNVIDLEIQSFSFRTQTTGIDDIRITIKNISDTPRDAVIWYIISPADDSAPWDNILYAPEGQNFDSIAPGALVTAEFPELIETLAPSEYTISFWVHVREGSITRHADGIAYWNRIWIGSGIVFGFDNAEIAFNNDTGLYDSEVTISVNNRTKTQRTLAISYTISNDILDFSDSEGNFYIAPFETFNLNPGEGFTRTYTGSMELEDGTYIYNAYLHEVADREQFEIDRVQFEGEFTLP